MKALKCFYLEFNSLVKNSTNQKNENMTGKGWVKGNKFNATFAGNTIISNGMKTWTIIKEEKAVYESDANSDDGSLNPKKIMTIWETGFKNKYEREELLNGEKVHVISLTPKSPSNSEYKSIVIYISKSTNSLKQAFIKSKDGTNIPQDKAAAQVNPDTMKERLPEWDEMEGTEAGRLTRAGFTHEESSYLAKRHTAAAFERQTDVVLDGTGDSSPESMIGKITTAKNAGYKVNGVYVTTPTEQALAGALARAAETGRTVLPTVIRETHAGVSRTFPSITNQFDSLQLWDTSKLITDKVSTLIGSGTGGKFEVVDPAAYQAFLDKGK